ncbi:hydrophobic surface binding protein A-domain-containing protein [Aspergillus carlsbadensis]|nr:hydrophobic surface binding protein A-domain-containing protein [Aspergillus carlsbadensis]
MKFFSIVALLPLGALAGPTLVDRSPTPLERDLATFQSILAGINTQVNSLDASIQATPIDADAVIAQSNALIETINNGVTVVQAQPVLSQFDALGLVAPTQDLSADTETTIQHLIAIKDTLVAGGYGCTTLEALEEQHAAALALAAAITAKVPAALQELAQELSAGIANAIQAGLDAYADACTVTTTTTTTTTTDEPTTTTTTTTTEEPTTTTTATTDEPTTTTTTTTTTTDEPTTTNEPTTTTTTTTDDCEPPTTTTTTTDEPTTTTTTPPVTCPGPSTTTYNYSAWNDNHSSWWNHHSPR